MRQRNQYNINKTVHWIYYIRMCLKIVLPLDPSKYSFYFGQSRKLNKSIHVKIKKVDNDGYG